MFFRRRDCGWKRGDGEVRQPRVFFHPERGGEVPTRPLVGRLCVTASSLPTVMNMVHGFFFSLFQCMGRCYAFLLDVESTNGLAHEALEAINDRHRPL